MNRYRFFIFFLLISICLVSVGWAWENEETEDAPVLEKETFQFHSGAMPSIEFEATWLTIDAETWEYFGGKGQCIGSCAIVLQSADMHKTIQNIQNLIQSGNPPETKARAELEKMLDSVVTLRYTNVAFRTVIDDLRKHFRLPISVDNEKLEEYGFDEDTPVTLSVDSAPLRDVLDICCAHCWAGWCVKGETIQIVDSLDSEETMELRMYHLPYDRNEIDSVFEAIQTHVAPESWVANAGVGDCMYITNARGGNLLVVQTYHIHRELERFLADFSLENEMPLAPNTPDWLEQPISVKYHNLAFTDVLADLRKRLDTPISCVWFPYEAQEKCPFDEKISFSAKNVPIHTLLTQLLEPLGLYWHYEDGTLKISMEDEYSQESEILD